jgi:hypothetical protein
VQALLHHPAPRASREPFLERLTPVWRAYVPVPPVDDVGRLWQGDFLLNRTPRALPVTVTLSAVMLAVAVAVLRRSVVALVFYLLATVGVLLFSLLIYTGTLYHHGHFFLALVMALWLAASRRGGTGVGSPAISPAISPASLPDRGGGTGRRVLALLDDHAQLLFGVLLAVQVVGGAFRLVGDWRLPFSTGEAAAIYMQAHGLRDSTIAVYPGFQAATIAGYLGRPLYQVDRRVSATYSPLYLRTETMDDAAVLAALRSCCLAQDRGAILVMNRALLASDRSMEIRELARFPEAMVSSERFYVYHVRSLR